MSAEQAEVLHGVGLQRVLGALLSEFDRIEFQPNPGNAGDALINAGAWQVFDRLGLSSRIVRPHKGAGAPVFVYPGGGNLIPRYSFAREVIDQRLKQPFERFILLPHTVRGNEDLLARMDERCHVFCRCRASYEHVCRFAPRAQVYLADDLALAIDVDRLMAPARQAMRLARLTLHPRRMRRYLRWRRRIASIRPIDGRLLLLRSDEEALPGEQADPRLDLSACHGSNYAVRAEAEAVAADFLRVLARADMVESDRLHVAIDASLLGRQVILGENDYGKNRAVYEMSMRGRFPRTRYRGSDGLAPPQ